MNSFESQDPPGDPEVSLTPREQRILLALNNGLGIRETMDTLGPEATYDHIKRVLNVVGASFGGMSREDALQKAVETLIPGPDDTGDVKSIEEAAEEQKQNMTIGQRAELLLNVAGQYITNNGQKNILIALAKEIDPYLICKCTGLTVNDLEDMIKKGYIQFRQSQVAKLKRLGT